MRNMIINKRYDAFSVSQKTFVRLRELEQPEAMQETDRGAYWPRAVTPQEPSLDQCGKRIPRDDDQLVRVMEELQEVANGHAADLKITKTDGGEQVNDMHGTWE